MGRSSSSSSPERDHSRHKKKKKSKEKDKDRRREKDKDKDRDKPRAHGDRDKDRHDRDLDRGSEPRRGERDRDRDRDRDKDRPESDRHRKARSRSRSHERKRHRSSAATHGSGRDDGRAPETAAGPEPPVLSHEEAVKKQRDDEQAALDAQMEERRRRVEEWRRKKVLAEGGDPDAPSVQGEGAVDGKPGEEQGDEELDENGHNKGWTLEDDDDDDVEGDRAAAGTEGDGEGAMDTENAEPKPAPAPEADDDDDDVDPLDAFMMTNSAQLVRTSMEDQQAAAAARAGAAAPDDDDVDPLDAFMSSHVLPAVGADLAAAGSKLPAPGLQQAEPGAEPAAQPQSKAVGMIKRGGLVPGRGAPSAGRGAAGGRGAGGRRPQGRRNSSDESSSDDDDEESSEDDDAEWARLVNAGKLSKGDRLGMVDHSQVEYPPFRKNFYIEVPELAKLEEKDIVELRKDDGVKVRGKNVPKPVRAWTQAGLSSKLLDLLKKNGFERPLSIQAQAIPIIMSGRDCIGIAKTGSGKTLAFVLPMMRHIKDQAPINQGDGPIGLLMAPTRELVQQIAKEIKKFGKPMNISCVAVFGGSGVANQISELKRGTESVVCTPGRMIDLLTTSNGKITNLRRVTYLVMDEADRMFDMGFEPQIMRIIQNVRPDRQTVMFSATFPRSVETLARKILLDPVEIQVGGRSVVNPDIEQIIELRPEAERFPRLLEVLGEWYGKGKMLIFVQSQEKCDSLFRDLLNYGYPCLSLHGGKDQSDREGTVSDFKGDVCNILVATSVAARGLDVKDLVLVLNYDVPNHHEDYVHRVGRTGRAGNKGTSITFIAEEEDQYAPDLVKALRDSNAVVPDDLLALANAFNEKRKQGLVQGHGSGFGGSGFGFDKSEEDQFKQARKSMAKELGLTVEEEVEEDADDGGVRKVDGSATQAMAGAKPGEAGTTTVAGAVISAEAMAAMARAAAASGPALAAPAPPSNPAAAAAVMAAAAVAARLVAGSGPVMSMSMAPPPVTPSINTAMLAAMASIPGVTLAPSAGGASVPVSGLSMQAAAQRAAALAASMSGTSSGRDATQPHYEAELEINEFPNHARWKVTHRESITNIAELTGAAVITKGVHVPPGRPVPEGERKIYLLIEGPTETSVRRAKQELKRILEETTEKVMRRDAPAAGMGGRYTIV